MKINGYKNSEIEIYYPDQKNNHLVILYPGYGYSLTCPIFFYIINFFPSFGYDILGIDYRYNENKQFISCSDEDKDNWVINDIDKIAEKVNEIASKYQKTTIIAKSLGTWFLLEQLKRETINKCSNYIWLTPGKKPDEIYDWLKDSVEKSLVIYGECDKNNKMEKVKKAKENKLVKIKKIKKAGHAFEEEGSVSRSITNNALVIKEILKYLRNRHST